MGDLIENRTGECTVSVDCPFPRSCQVPGIEQSLAGDEMFSVLSRVNYGAIPKLTGRKEGKWPACGIVKMFQS